MITAFVLLNVAPHRITAIADVLSAKPSVSEVYSVSGRYDLVAVVRVLEIEALSRVITEELLTTEGITHSETMLAFRTFSRHDLESLFSLGAES